MKSIFEAEWKSMKIAWNKSSVLGSEIVGKLDGLKKLLDFKKK